MRRVGFLSYDLRLTDADLQERLAPLRARLDRREVVGSRALPRSLATKAGGFVFVLGQPAKEENGDVSP